MSALEDIELDKTTDKSVNHKHSHKGLGNHSFIVIEPPKAAAGRFLHRLGPFLSYILMFSIPLIFVAIVYAIIPIGPFNNESPPRLQDSLVFLLVTNPFIFSAVGYLYCTVIMGFLEKDRPFRISIIPIIAVYIVQVLVFSSLYLNTRLFALSGLVAFSLCLLTVIASLHFTYPSTVGALKSAFLRFMVPFFVFTLILSLYVVAYREVSTEVEVAIVMLLAFLTFVFRRTTLALLDPYPLELSQLVSGFGIQNLNDIFQTLAFPQVNEPLFFVAIWFSNAFANFAMLVFISDTWILRIRPFLKSYVLGKPIEEPDFSDNPEDRGHGPNVGGYRRRQFRFFFWRLCSVSLSMILYLTTSPLLRFGHNRDNYPQVRFDQYENSMVFASANLGFQLCVLAGGYYLLLRKFPKTYEEIRNIHGKQLFSLTYIGFVIATVSHSLLLSLALMLRNYCIFGAFRGRTANVCA